MTAYGIAGRGSSGYVTDGVNDTYCLGAAGVTNPYPTTRATSGGKSLTFGTVGLGGDEWTGYDRDNAQDVRIAGILLDGTGTVTEFKFDWPDGAGDYDIRVAVCDAVFDMSPYAISLKFYDDASLLFTLAAGAGPVIGHVLDANAVNTTFAGWTGTAGTAKRVTASGGTLRVVANNVGTINWLTYVSLEKVTASGTGGMVHHLRNMGAY